MALWKIRPYRSGDEWEIIRIAECCFEQSIRPFYTEEGRLLFAGYILPPEILNRIREGAVVLVADAGESLAGVLEIREGKHLSMLFVDPEFQGCGIARQLLERAAKFLLKIAPDEKELRVFAAPGAVAAYRALGFTETGNETFESGIRYLPMKKRLR